MAPRRKEGLGPPAQLLGGGPDRGPPGRGRGWRQPLQKNSLAATEG